MNLGQYAEHCGVSRREISREVREGKLEGSYVKNGKSYIFDVKKADRARAENLDQIKSQAGNARKEIKVDDNLHKVQVAKHYWRAQLLELDAKVRLGEYVKKVDVDRIQFDAVRRFRDSLFSLLDRMIPVSIGKGEIEMFKMWRRELTKTLKELSEELKG